MQMKTNHSKIQAITLLLCLLSAWMIPASAQPKQEVRAAWITTAYGLDWPRTKATSAASRERQKAELIEMLDKLKDAHFNTILFQARTRGDVLYRSDIEPMNAVLTGQVDGDPGYDPLAFAVEECHKRGMECHAWMVTLPLGSRKHVIALGKQSVTKKHPALCVNYRRHYYLNAGNLLKILAVEYGIDPKVVYPHSFRHRFAKNFLAKFNDIALLADLMGHESIETTRVYLRRTATEQRELIDRIVTW